MLKHLISVQNKWWRRRESNPRPKPLGVSVYVRILGFTDPGQAPRPA